MPLPPGQAPGTPGPQGRGRRWALVATAALIIIALVGVGAWFTTRGGATAADDPTEVGGWPSNPQLRHTYTVELADNLFGGMPEVSGNVNDVYIGESGADMTTLSRHFNGDSSWETQVGLGDLWFIHDWDGKIVLETNSTPYGEQSQLVRINPADGSTIWSISADGSTNAETYEGRLYVLQYGDYEGETDELAEYDFESGTELKRLTGANYSFAESGFIAIDPDASTAQQIDLNLNPVGNPVPVETSGVQFYPWIVSDTPDGLIYYADDKAVGLGWDGTVSFECTISIDEPNSVHLHDESTLVASSYGSIEVLDLNGSQCTSRWTVTGDDNTLIYDYGGYPVKTTYDATGESVDFVNDTSVVEVLDWQTGETKLRGEGGVLFDRQGAMATMEGDAIVARKIDTGEELWRVAATQPSDFSIMNGMLVVITPVDGTATINVYAD